MGIPKNSINAATRSTRVHIGGGNEIVLVSLGVVFGATHLVPRSLVLAASTRGGEDD